MSEQFHMPMIVRIDGIWRPVYGKIIEENAKNKAVVRFTLNGKILEESSYINYRYFDETTTLAKLNTLAIQYNVHDLDVMLSIRDAEERQAKRNKRIKETSGSENLLRIIE